MHLALFLWLILIVANANIINFYRGANTPPFWTNDMVAESIVVDSSRQYKALIEKLDSGQPINVVGFGSSVIEAFGGCYSDKGKQFMAKNRGITQACDNPPHMIGWGTMFMKFINSTWPHPEHMFANAGIGGATLSVFVHICIEDVVPDPVDLIILENMGGRTHTRDVEQLMSALFQLSASRRTTPGNRPAVILFNSFFVAPSKWNTCIRNANCSAHCAPERIGFTHEVVGSGSLFARVDVGSEAATFSLGEYYGITVLSLGHLLFGGMRDGVIPSEGVAACEFLTLFMADYIHPNQLGRRLFADMHISVIQSARAFFSAAHNNSNVVTAIKVPREPFIPGGSNVIAKICYMYTARSPGLVQGMDMGRVSQVYLPVIKSEGWKFVFYDRDPRHVKPGMFADKPGSVLLFEMDTALPGVDASTTVCSMNYLASYENRGSVVIECISGCQCRTRTVDSSILERYSVTRTLEIPVTPSTKCVMQITSQPGVTGTIFKVTGLTVRALSTNAR